LPLVDMHYVAFIMGLFVADLKFNKSQTIFSKYYCDFLNTRGCLIACYTLGIYFSCCTMFKTPLYSWWFSIPGVNKSLLRGLGMAMLIFAFTKTSVVQKMLSWKPWIMLGKYSFEIYAIHWPLMLSLEAFLFIGLRPFLSYNASALLSFLITLPAILLVSIGMHRLIDTCGRIKEEIFKIVYKRKHT
ncbi:MAG: acyltransferase, partial [Clostridia bacterium]|nr:acyltransferase [Clostridia bacterium]